MYHGAHCCDVRQRASIAPHDGNPTTTSTCSWVNLYAGQDDFGREQVPYTLDKTIRTKKNALLVPFRATTDRKLGGNTAHVRSCFLLSDEATSSSSCYKEELPSRRSWRPASRQRETSSWDEKNIVAVPRDSESNAARIWRNSIQVAVHGDARCGGESYQWSGRGGR
jgi:hypothetical protein